MGEREQRAAHELDRVAGNGRDGEQCRVIEQIAQYCTRPVHKVSRGTYSEILAGIQPNIRIYCDSIFRRAYTFYVRFGNARGLHKYATGQCNASRSAGMALRKRGSSCTRCKQKVATQN